MIEGLKKNSISDLAFVEGKQSLIEFIKKVEIK